jgi:hypothetical protein
MKSDVWMGKTCAQTGQVSSFLPFSLPLWVLGFEFRAYTLSHSISLFCEGCFQDWVLGLIRQGCLGTMILLIFAYKFLAQGHPAS